MLGEIISTGKGKRTARRVVSTDAQLKVEVSFEDASTMLGVEGINIGTYVSSTKPDGSLHGEGQGVFASLAGDIVMWKGIGTGVFGAAGAVRYVGSLDYTTTSAKLAKLNSVAGVFEFDVDGNGNTESKIWEWK